MKTWVLTLSSPNTRNARGTYCQSFGMSRSPAGRPVSLNPQTQSQNLRWKVIKEYTRPQPWLPCVHASGTCTHMHVLHMYTRRIYFQGYQRFNGSIIFYITLKCWVSNIDILKRSQAWWYTLVILSLRRLQQGDCKFETKNLSQKQKQKPTPKNKKWKQNAKQTQMLLWVILLLFLHTFWVPTCISYA